MVYIDMPIEEITQDLAREALTGRIPQLSPSAALALMEHGGVPDLDAATALQDAAANQELEPTVRVGAVRAYLHLGTPDAPQVLAGLLGVDSERVAGAAAAALGQAGAPACLQALRELRDRATEEGTHHGPKSGSCRCRTARRPSQSGSPAPTRRLAGRRMSCSDRYALVPPD